jgi:hypothetical protein
LWGTEFDFAFCHISHPPLKQRVNWRLLPYFCQWSTTKNKYMFSDTSQEEVGYIERSTCSFIKSNMEHQRKQNLACLLCVIQGCSVYSFILHRNGSHFPRYWGSNITPHYITSSTWQLLLIYKSESPVMSTTLRLNLRPL